MSFSFFCVCIFSDSLLPPSGGVVSKWLCGISLPAGLNLNKPPLYANSFWLIEERTGCCREVQEYRDETPCLIPFIPFSTVATWNFFLKHCFWKCPLDGPRLLPWPGLGAAQRMLSFFTTGWAQLMDGALPHHWQLLNFLPLEPFSYSCLETDLLMYFLTAINNFFYTHCDL